MEYVLGFFVWCGVALIFCWFWGSFARFTEDPDLEVKTTLGSDRLQKKNGSSRR